MWGNPTRILQIDGFDIKVDASWLIIAALIVWSLATAYFPVQLPGTRTATLVVMAIVAMYGLFLSLILHELAHALVAQHFGLRTSGITLFLFGGIAELESEPLSARTEFWIAIAGPVASLCLALMFWIGTNAAAFVGSPGPVLVVLDYLALINLVLAVFNILPAFPMDGGRILRALLWARSGDLLVSTARAVKVAAFAAYTLIALGLYAAFSGALIAGLWPVLIGLFLLATSRAALTQLEAKLTFDGRTVAALMTPDPWTVGVNQSLSELVDQVFLTHAVTFAPVVEDDTLLGYVDTQIVRKIDRENWTTTTVEDVIENVSNDNTVPFDLSVQDLLALITKTGRRKFLVVDAVGLVGIVTLSDILAVLHVAREVGYAPHKPYSQATRD